MKTGPSINELHDVLRLSAKTFGPVNQNFSNLLASLLSYP
mgnify:CR=1 FL=1